MQKVGDSSDTSSPDEIDNQFSQDEVEVNANFIRDSIAEQDWKMIAELTDAWQIPFKKRVWALLTEPEKEIVKRMAPLKSAPIPAPEPEIATVSSGWRNCIIKNLKVGDRVKCFPTNWHFENKKCVTGKVVALEVDNTNPEYLALLNSDMNLFHAEEPLRCGGSPRCSKWRPQSRRE